MHFTYIIENPKGLLYIGYSANIKTRLNWHNQGRSKFTKNKGPWKLIFHKAFLTKTEALKYENYLKSTKNKTYIKQIIKVTDN